MKPKNKLKTRLLMASQRLTICFKINDSVFPFSDEDTDVKALVKSWLQSQPEEDRRMLETFLEDHFYKALDWVLKQNEFVVESSLVGVVMNGLSHMHGVKVKAEFACCLIRGLGANLSPTAKTAFAKEVTLCLD